MTIEPQTSGYAPVNGLKMYWESYGANVGTPLVALHGGYGRTTMLAPLIEPLAARRRVVAAELQGHGHTGDIDRPWTFEDFGEDVVALADELGIGTFDILGYSLGAGAALRAAIQHPDRIRRLVAVSFPCRRDGWLPEIRAAFDRMGRGDFEMFRRAPLYEAWRRVAPDPDAFPAIMDKMGELQRRPFDWTADLARVTADTLLVYADADSIPPSHAAECYAALGGGGRDAGWEGTDRTANRLAVLPATSHYDIASAPLLLDAVTDFLD